MAHLDWKASDLKVVQQQDRTVAHLGEWEMTVWRDFGDGEPRVRDTDAAARLELGRLRDVRKLIERTWPQEKMRPQRRATVARQSTRHGGTRSFTVQEYWLTEAQLLKLCARSTTKVADVILDDMIRVYMAVRRGLQPVAPVGDVYAARRADIDHELDETVNAVLFAFPGVDVRRLRPTILQYALGHVNAGGTGRELGYWDEATYLALRAVITGMRSLVEALRTLGLKPRALPALRKGRSLGNATKQLVLDLGCHKITVLVEPGSNDGGSSSKSA